MTPRVGRSRPTIILATVVLPEPDSPTIASEPPSGTENPTSSTATNGPYSFRRPSTDSTGSGMGANPETAEQLARASAAGEAPVELDQVRPALAANVRRVRAAGGEAAGGDRRLEGRQRTTRNCSQPVSRRLD